MATLTRKEVKRTDYVLTLTEDEAAVIYDIVAYKILGDDAGPRQHASSIWQVLTPYFNNRSEIPALQDRDCIYYL
jgi:hypothetical protein